MLLRRAHVHTTWMMGNKYDLLVDNTKNDISIKYFPPVSSEERLTWERRENGSFCASHRSNGGPLPSLMLGLEPFRWSMVLGGFMITGAVVLAEQPVRNKR